MKMESEDERNLKRSWRNDDVWKWCELDGNKNDN
jgi:hypothetical protein